jgi:hypothetical protein
MGSSLGVLGGLGGSLLGQADSNALKVRSLLHAACSALHCKHLKCVLLHAAHAMCMSLNDMPCVLAALSTDAPSLLRVTVRVSERTHWVLACQL